MTTQRQIELVDYCPVCRTLPLNTVAFGVEGPHIEYHLANDEVDVNLSNGGQFDKCALYFLVRSLHLIWSDNGDFPTSPLPVGSGLDSTCGGPNCLTVMADQNTLIGNIYICLMF
jgi:hypothetical protein